MKYLKLVILLLVFGNLPGYFMVHVNTAVGSVLSYSTFLLIIIYYLSTDLQKPIVPFIVFGLLFSLISLMVSTQFFESLLVTFMKYFLFIIMVSSLIKDVKIMDMYCVLLIGSLSIIYEAFFVLGIEAGGFYLNANSAAYACLIGYILGLTIEDKKLKIVGQILFSVAGLLTFSKTFLLIWVLINFLSLFVNYKNIYKVVMCGALFAVFLLFGDKFDLNTQSKHVFSDIFAGKTNENFIAGTRTEKWTHYYDKILNRPIWGNGYHAFSDQIVGNESNRSALEVGVHNTYLMIIGEAGIFALLYFLWIYGYLLVRGIHFFKDNPIIFLLSFSLILFMLTNRDYFDNYLVLFISLWLYHETYRLNEAHRQKEILFIKSKENNKESNKENLLKHYSLN